MVISQTAVDRCVAAAHNAGATAAQVRAFLEAGYVPQPKQWQFHAPARTADLSRGPVRVGYGGARGPGKSHASFAQAALDDCQRVAGLKVLFLRKIGKAAAESFADLISKTLRYTEHKYNSASGAVYFPNGSKIITGNYRTESDIDKYLGIEYDLIIVEEATQLSKIKYDMLMGSLRTSKPNWRPRAYLTTNPGGIGHQWFKKLFVTPAKNGREDKTRFIFGNYKDNAFLNREYIEYLESLTGVLGRMWRDGDWDVGAGMFFVNWSHERHVIKPIDIPVHWPMWASFDYGFTHPTSVHLHTKWQGNVYTVAEHVASRWLPPQHARRIHELVGRFHRSAAQLRPFVAGHDAFASKGDRGGKTIADQYRELGIQLTRANIDRVSGAAEMLRRLGNPEAGIRPTWFIFDTCPRLIETIPAMQVDPHRPEDVLKVDANDEGLGGDDCFVAGTPVLTEFGNVPIELIRPNDKVLTRVGWRPVRDVWQAHQDSEVLKLHLSDGRTITCTPNHPFWVKGKGFTFVDALRYGDIIQDVSENMFYRSVTCQSQKQLSSMELNSDVIQVLKNALIASITGRGATIENEALALYMSKFGKQKTETSQRVTISTIKTAIRLTMLLRISSAYLLRSMPLSTLRNDLATQTAVSRFLSTWMTFGRLLPLGIAPMRDWHGIASMAKLCLATDPLLSRLASSAARPIKSGTPTPPTAAFAPINASQSGVERLALTMSKRLAPPAEKPFSQTSIGAASTAAENALGSPVVVKVEPAGMANSYAIHVAGQHEYYANGLLVRNCYDDARYGLMVESGRGGFAVKM